MAAIGAAPADRYDPSVRRVATVIGVVLLMVTVPARAADAHDHREQARRQRPPTEGPVAPPSPQTVVASPASAGAVRAATSASADVTVSGTVTNLPNDPAMSYQTPSDPCAAPSCLEYQLDVSDDAGALYGRVAWKQPSQYVHLWGIQPDGKVVGQTDVDDDYDKTVGNERTIPVAEFTVKDPAPGVWRVQVRAVFGFEIEVDGRIVTTPREPVAYDRLGVRELADKFGRQNLRVNVVFLGRTPTREQLAVVKARMPDQYRSSVLVKTPPDSCEEADKLACAAGGNWGQTYYGGTDRASDDTPDGAGGNVPYFEPVRFTYDYRYFEADERYTRDFFGYIESITKQDAPYDGGNSFASEAYNAAGGQYRRVDGGGVLPSNARVSDKIDGRAVEDWVFQHRLDPAYATSFVDIERGTKRDGSFIAPDPSAYLDPFYTASGARDLTRMPQGPRTSVTMYVIDSYSTPLAREYFRADRYHSYDVSHHMIDPDSGSERAPDYMRLWGGNYPFFFLDLGAQPNRWETAQPVAGAGGDSTTFPRGDPPVWEALHNPLWGEPYKRHVEDVEHREAADVEYFALWDKVARNVRSSLFLRFTAPYLYRPLPADVFFLASNVWSDYYSRPAPPFGDGGGTGLSYSRLDQLYKPSFVETNLGSALPGATFTTERDDPKLRTYRYLGCSDEIAGSTSQLLGEGGVPGVMVPNPTCTSPDPVQRALERAKAQGDDIFGAGVPVGAVSASVMRSFIEEHRNEYAPLRPGQLTMTSISTVFPDGRTWYLPFIVGGVAFNTPNNEIWGILQNVTEWSKPSSATDCDRSVPVAPGCNGVPPYANRAFSYVVQHEASHFLGLLHPHDTLVVEQNEEGRWERYAQTYVSLFDFSQAPTTYAGSFYPYSVLDQDIIQRGHWAEYLRQAQDTIADAYLVDGMDGRAGPSAATLERQAQMERWRALGAQLFACGDYLHASHAGRNAVLAAQGVFGPVVAPRQLSPGERVLFDVRPQPVFGPDGRIDGCDAGAALPRLGGGAGAGGAGGAGGGALPATGGAGGAGGSLALSAAGLLVAVVAIGRRLARRWQRVGLRPGA